MTRVLPSGEIVMRLLPEVGTEFTYHLMFEELVRHLATTESMPSTRVLVLAEALAEMPGLLLNSR